MAESDVNIEVATTHVCKRCGRPDLTKDIEVDEAVMRDYMRCALGGKLFTRTFSILNGELNVTMVALPADCELALERYLATPESDIDAMDMRLLLSLENIEVFDQETSGFKSIYHADLTARKKVLENPRESLNQLAKNADAVLLGALRRMSTTFVILQNAVLEAAVNSDFYKGVGLL